MYDITQILPRSIYHTTYYYFRHISFYGLVVLIHGNTHRFFRRRLVVNILLGRLKAQGFDG
jgi:hypothetical protein